MNDNSNNNNNVYFHEGEYLDYATMAALHERTLWNEAISSGWLVRIYGEPLGFTDVESLMR